ncbi:competence type IV pilus assembly protein ComGB [Aquibacillus sediminis]|uniref:competence type IV pilus assembly protein ComGB n=1 Tax=Aquibacillus sediminis TaxID=2574734 RepID=UPI001108D71E|nr:competence type IV pilus assembly protein ComGB [Aquibacillus sediminis]
MPMVLQDKKFLTWTNREKMPLIQQYKFLQQLQRLIQHGYPLLDALEVLQWEQQWAQPSSKISISLKEGMPLDQALQEANFNDKIVSFMYLSRSNGDLDKSLNQCCLMLDQQINQMNNFKQTIRYPFILFVLFCILLYFVKTNIYPSFLRLMQTSGQSSPVTDLSIKIINYLFNGSTFIVGFVIIITLMWVTIRNRIKIPIKIKIYTLLPLVRHYQKWSVTFVFSLQVASLLKAGFSLKEALLTIRKQEHAPIIVHYADYIINQLQQGIAINTILPSCQLFENELTSIFTKSTNNHTLETDLNMYATFVMNRMQERTTKLIKLIQPIFFILLAGLIILVYLSLMLPMFQFIQTM